MTRTEQNITECWDEENKEFDWELYQYLCDIANMSVYEFCNLYINKYEDMEIWDEEKGETVFSGTFDEATDSEFSDEEVSSFGIERGKIVININ